MSLVVCLWPEMFALTGHTQMLCSVFHLLKTLRSVCCHFSEQEGAVCMFVHACMYLLCQRTACIHAEHTCYPAHNILVLIASARIRIVSHKPSLLAHIKGDVDEDRANI